MTKILLGVLALGLVETASAEISHEGVTSGVRPGRVAGEPYHDDAKIELSGHGDLKGSGVGNSLRSFSGPFAGHGTTKRSYGAMASMSHSVSSSTRSYWKDEIFYLVKTTHLNVNGLNKIFVERRAFSADKRWYRHVMENGRTLQGWTLIQANQQPDVWSDEDGIHVSPRILEPLDEPNESPREEAAKRKPITPIIQNVHTFAGTVEVLD